MKHVSVLLHTVDWTLPSSSNRRYYCGLPFLRCVSLLFTEEVLHLRARSMLDLEARDICQGDLKLVRVVGISPSVSLETWNAHGKMLLLELRCCWKYGKSHVRPSTFKIPQNKGQHHVNYVGESRSVGLNYQTCIWLEAWEVLFYQYLPSEDKIK